MQRRGAVKLDIRRGLSGNALKIIAMLSMLIDHIGFYLFPKLMFLRAVGRIAFPIFAFMIAEGCAYTKNRVRYLGLIAMLGAVCQAAAIVASHSLYMNILITFSLAIVTIYAIDTLRGKWQPLPCTAAILALVAVALITFVLPRVIKGFLLDYGEFGVLIPALLYYVKGTRRKALGLAIVLAARAIITMPIQWFSLLAIPLLFFYNGKRGRAKLKYLFYVFYPTHQAILWLIAELFRR